MSGVLGKVSVSAINLPEIELIDREDNTSLGLEAGALEVCVLTTTVVFRVINKG